MLTDKRDLNKSFILRRAFKWGLTVVSVVYFAFVLTVRISYDYEDARLATQMDDKYGVKMDQISLERNVSKIVPDFLSNWAIFKAVLVVIFAIALFFVQSSEDEHA